MSSRRNGNSNNNRIRGPQSALTDFLASNNISAAQIRADYEARQRNAALQGQPSEQSHSDDEDVQNSDVGEESDTVLSRANSNTQRKRKRQEKAALDKIKRSKAFKKRKAGLAGEPGENDDERIAFDLYERSRPPPGQLSNCELCGKRFTVTSYSKEGPDGGLLCPKCSKQAKDDEQNARKVKKVAAAKRGGRRQKMSDLLDGKIASGSKSLVDLCLQKVADVSNDIEDFGALPETLLDRLSMIFSKRRKMTTRTSHLFLRSDRDRIVIYDAAELETSDFAEIFAVATNLKHLKLTNAGQMKDATIDYMIDKKIRLESLQLEAPNLISDERWQKLFSMLGPHLNSFKIAYMDATFTDATVKCLVQSCPNLKRLKIRDCSKLGEESLIWISQLQHLEHLSLRYECHVSAEALAELIGSVGARLQTLSLDRFELAGDQVLEKIHQCCKRLRKLRFIYNDYASDAAFSRLFTSWRNTALSYADLHSCRDIDDQPSEGSESPIGLASGGFEALMSHSGKKLQHLNISSCRHITHQTLLSVFDGKSIYPHLREIDMSLIPEVDDTVVSGVFKSCPELKKMIVFACFGVRDIEIPHRVALIGTPKAQDTIVQGRA